MDSLLATEPKQNAVVSASAGTGKTWLLVSRIIRLLLAGQKPSTILAVTFTRKAAGEMQARVIDRIFEFSHLADDQLDAALTQIGLNQPDQPLRTKARELYESLIYGVEPIRITTFHSFCQDLLRKFPLEVNVSPGFHIATATHLMEQQALDALYDRATQQPKSLLAQHLDRLAQQLASPERLRTVLQMFLLHTSDWWAYSEDQTDSHEFAKQNIIDFFNINIQQDPISCFTSTVVTDLRLYLKLLGQHTTKTFQQLGYKLGPVVASDSIDPGQFSTIKEIFLTQTNQPRKYKANNSMAKSMGEQGQQEFLSLHNKICAQLLDTLDALACRQVLSLSQAWFYVGDQYLSNYQKNLLY